MLFRSEGTVEYQRFNIDPGWKEDKWIKHIECRPGNPSVVHHIIVYLRPPAGPKKSGAGRLVNDWLAAYAPGSPAPNLGEGYARYAPAGSQLVFEVHYTPNGTKQKDKSFCGIIFADPKSVKKEVAVKNAGSFDFRIPPGAENHQVDSYYNFRENSLLVSVSPHMHLRGKDFRYDLVYPDGKTETILWVPRYDFGWQTTYTFKEPKRLPKGTKMHCVAHFDNSENNLSNPDPKADVRFGEQTWEEMMFGWFEVALEDQDLTKPQPTPVPRTKTFLAGLKAGEQANEQVIHLAREVLAGKEPFGRFCFQVRDSMPQVDRICVTFVDDGKLRIFQAIDFDSIRTGFSSPATVLPASGELLARTAASDQPIVVEDLSKAEGKVARRLASKGFASSYHLPIEVNGKKGTLSLWSQEKDAFNPQVLEFFQPAAAALPRAR